MFANLIAVQGDATADITTLQRVDFVMKRGRVIADDIGQTGTQSIR